MVPVHGKLSRLTAAESTDLSDFIARLNNGDYLVATEIPSTADDVKNYPDEIVVE